MQNNAYTKPLTGWLYIFLKDLRIALKLQEMSKQNET